MPSALAAGLKSRCPACGRDPLFEGFLRVRERCPACGADLSGQDSGDGAVAFIVLIVGGIVVGLALVTEVRYQPPVWRHLLLWLPLTVDLVLALMLPFKSVLIELHFKHRRDDFGERA
ncbi:MAG: DUF983 domain-containing protein [Geminicoccaceae bacterium]